MSKLRHNQKHPCPVCGGYDAQRRGSGKRCHGFTSDDGYAHCSQVPCGEEESNGTYAHRLSSSCRCGTPHGSVIVEASAPETAVVDHVAAWQALDRRSVTGERYLQSRGLDSHELRERGIVRFHRSYGSPAIAIRDLATGNICGIQYRRTDGGEPKTPSAKGSKCSGAALHGRVAELDREGVDVAIIVEGFADTLAAALAFPGCAVFGATGAGQLATIATAVARRVLEVRGWLLIVVDDDDIGVRRAADAVNAAKSAGLRYVPLAEQTAHGAGQVRLVDIGEHHDLADAWKAGWRYRWPGPRGAA